MKIAVLGASGFLGHFLCNYFLERHDVIAVFRRRPESSPPLEMGESLPSSVESIAYDQLLRFFERLRPNVVINCIARLPQHNKLVHPEFYNAANVRLPAMLARAAKDLNFKLVHISSDAVFSGRLGQYSELAIPDPVCPYGQSKLMGEQITTNSITLRTSFFGVSHNGTGLVNWLIANSKPQVSGYKNYVFSALSVATLAHRIELIIYAPTISSGLFHVGGPPVSKLQLLRMLADRLRLSVRVDEVCVPVVDRSLDSRLLESLLHLQPPLVSEMVDQVAAQYLAKG
jgi:dTDP-4-dehydrorhamnose reductase